MRFLNESCSIQIGKPNTGILNLWENLEFSENMHTLYPSFLSLTPTEVLSPKFEEAVHPLSDDPVFSYSTILFQYNRIRSHGALRNQLQCQNFKENDHTAKV